MMPEIKSMRPQRLRADKWAAKAMWVLTVSSGLLIFFIVVGLYLRSRPILALKPFHEIIFSTVWRPLKGEFGLFPFIMGTVWVTGVAMALAVPLSLLTAIYLSEYASSRTRAIINPLIDLLAGIPSIVYGMWGVLVIVPFIKDVIAPACGVSSSGYTILAGGIVLAIMIFPIIIHVTVEVFSAVPQELREASLCLGATSWQTVKHVVIRKALPGIIAAIVLGLSRAFGETMAVLMVVGNVARLPSSALDPAYPLPALIANNYGEMLSVPLYDSALLLASLVLLIVVVVFNVISKAVLMRVEKGIQ